MADDRRSCWVCLEDEDPTATQSPSNPFCHPCKCTHLDVHQLCLLRWIAERQAIHPAARVKCPACLHVYEIEEDVDLIEILVSHVERVNTILLPYATFTALATSVYVMSTAYGAYAIVAACGSEFAESMLSDESAPRTWIGMPIIPFALIASRMDIADSILPILPFVLVSNNTQPIPVSFPPSPTVTLCLLPWSRLIYKETWRLIYHFSTPPPADPTITDALPSLESPQGQFPFTVPSSNLRRRPPGPPKSLPRLILGALLLPTFASVAGSVLALIPGIKTRLPSTFLRTAVGGALMILARDCFLYWEFLRKRSRGFGTGKRVLNYRAPLS
ncbi:hypothetical protein BDR26DRAFT_859917 [Obelidium mucronatum]|nr:hypothetical protein BDR26DRAFT_859917 [Obelidium mucronatum]